MIKVESVRENFKNRSDEDLRDIDKILKMSVLLKMAEVVIDEKRGGNRYKGLRMGLSNNMAVRRVLEAEQQDRKERSALVKG